MPTEEEIADQRELLATYRRTLSRYLRQLAQHGAANAPPSLFEGIHEAREQIQRIKVVLRRWNVAVDDHPNDIEALDVAQNTLTMVGTGAGGHWLSQVAVVPQSVTRIDDLLGALLAHDVELRVMPSLWQLHEAVMDSTLHHSMIRMRNAIRRETE